MEDLKLDNVEQSPNGEPSIYAENDTCVLEESDAQCGYVFYNEFTRLLKFYCTYCQETYDNIQYFCQHLSDHIHESSEELYPKVESQYSKNELEVDSMLNIEDEEHFPLILETNSTASQNCDEDTRDAFEYVHHELGEKEESLSNENCEPVESVDDNLGNEDMFIEELEADDELKAEIELKEHEQIQEEHADNLFLTETFSAELENCDENEILLQENNLKLDDNLTKNGSSFEECFIKETNIDKIRSEGVCVLKDTPKAQRKPFQKKRPNIQDLLRFKRQRRKVTTVKVIAVKNRIAELYERIQSEQQKSQQIFSNDFLKEHHEQETQDALESLVKDGTEKNNKTEAINDNQGNKDEKTSQSSLEISRKIIGETLITLIPEGAKIPDKMPLTLSTLNNEFIKNELMSTSTNTSYNHLEKLEEKKEKLATCPACGKIFRSHFSLTIHKRIHYLESDSSVKLAHKCSDCDQLFNKLSQLKHHVETVHYPEGFICKICNRQLSSLSLLERHMVKVHLDRPFNCKKCNKNFSDPVTYEEHLASHDSGEVFKCTTCGRKYATEYFLLEHMRNHKEQVPQTCVVCGKITLRITQHMKTHTPRPKRLLSCSECGKVFNFSSGLSHHFKIMHKLPRPQPKPKKEIHANGNTYKRKRRSRPNERNISKKKHLINSNMGDSSFIIDNGKFSNQIIEEQIEIPHDAYGAAATTNSIITNLGTKENQIIESIDLQTPSQTYNIATMTSSHGQQQQQAIIQNVHQDAVINHKEEEAKRVIVELIQNSAYTSFFSENLSSVLEVTPPIAREETISAVNSIVHDC